MRTAALVAVLFSITTFSVSQRLPHTAVPDHYSLTFTLHFDNDTFSGDEIIDLRILQPASALTLNAAEIEFKQVTIAAGGTSQTATVTSDAKAETATFTFPKPLPAGPAVLHILYSGHLNGELRGLYLSKSNGRKYAVSQFESTDARRAYPCFDEPAYKATFDIAAVIPNGDMAISNGPAVSDSPGPAAEQHTVTFATTGKMSTYLVALVVGEFKCLEGNSDGIPIRVCGTPERYQLGKFALDAAEHTLHFYDQYFDIKYPYKKLDFVGVADFSAGAMENTACIVSREELLYGDPKSSTPHQLKEIAQQAVAHEMAHQWFGDLVTMQWWNDAWLNEGFATWMAFKPMEEWKPEWHVDQDRVISYAHAMSWDSLQATHPIMVKVENPGQIEEIFDEIIYDKAAAILHMVEGYLGPEVFRQGVNAYLKKYQYANATAEDFWNTIAQVSHKPADRIMSSYVVEPGVPLVMFREDCRDGNTTTTISQHRYFYDRKLLESRSQQTWTIPVCAKGSQEKCELLTTTEATFTIPGCAAVYGNAGARGYYRSAYTDAVSERLATEAENVLSAGERIMLATDMWGAIRISRENVGGFLALAQTLRSDRSNALAHLVHSSLQYIDEYLTNPADQAKYRAWLRDDLEPVMDQIGWVAGSNDSEDIRQIRGSTLRVLGLHADDPRAITEAQAITQKNLARQPVDLTLVQASLSIAARHGDASLFDAYMARIRSPRDPGEFLRYIAALSEFRQPDLIKRALEFGLSPDMRSQDAISFFAIMLGTPNSREQSWQFVREHWNEVETKVTSFAAGFLVDAAGSFCDAKHREEVRTFFTEHKIPTASRKVDQAVERINSCIDIKAQQTGRLAAWLDQHETTTHAGK